MTSGYTIDTYKDSSSFEDKSYELDGITRAMQESTASMIREQALLLDIVKNGVPLNEGVGDILSSIKEGLAKFIRFLINLAKKFFDKLLSFINDDKFIQNNMAEVAKMGAFKFKSMGYKFTFYRSQMSDVFEDMAREVSQIAAHCSIKHTPEDIVNAIARFKNANIINNTDEFYNYIRGKFLANKYGAFVEYNGFDTKAFKSFRDNEIRQKEITVDGRYMKDIIDRLKTPKTAYEALKTDVRVEITRCEKSVNIINRSLEVIFDRIYRMRGNTKMESNCITSAYSLYIKLSNAVDQMNSIIGIYAGIRMDAIKEMAEQDKRMVREAIFKYKEFKRGLL